MIYIITPCLKDFRSVCALKKIKCDYNFNNMPISPTIRWLNSWKSLFGIKIEKKDQILYGFKFSNFSVEEQKQIQMEVQLRKVKC